MRKWRGEDSDVRGEMVFVCGGWNREDPMNDGGVLKEEESHGGCALNKKSYLKLSCRPPFLPRKRIISARLLCQHGRTMQFLN